MTGITADSILTLGQRWSIIGTSVGPTLAANVGPTAFWLTEATLAQLPQHQQLHPTGKKILLIV